MLAYCSCHQFGNYVIQTLLNNYPRDPRTEHIVKVDQDNSQSLKDNAYRIIETDYGAKLLCNLQGLIGFQDPQFIKRLSSQSGSGRGGHKKQRGGGGGGYSHAGGYHGMNQAYQQQGSQY